MRRYRTTQIGWLAFVLLGVWQIAQAQPIQNPSTLEFQASPDHNVVDLSVPNVSSYELEFYLAGATAPVQRPSIGKPTPDASGKITVNLNTVARPILLAGTYTVKAVAIGAGGGVSKSPDSSPFILAPRTPAPPGTPIPK